MLLAAPSRDRPYHFGPFPLESLARDESGIRAESERAPPLPAAPDGPAAAPLAAAARRYLDYSPGCARIGKG